MIKEAYVSFETAKLLKEKGFEEETIPFYEKDGKFCSRIGNVCQPCDWSNEYKFGFYSAPTQQMAMCWLREKHNIFLSIQQHLDMSYVWYIYADGVPRGCDRESHNNSYEDSVEAAIKYCLKNLI